MGIINEGLEALLGQENARIRLCEALVRPVLCYGSELWTYEVKLMRGTAAHTKWDHERKDDILTK
jgi:hypothetical protein